MRRKAIRSALYPNGAPAFSCLPGSINFIRADSIMIAHLIPFEEAEAVGAALSGKGANETSPRQLTNADPFGVRFHGFRSFLLPI